MATNNVITRERLKDGSLLAEWRATAPAGSPVRSDEEIAASLKAALAERPAEGDVWVFGYGSLIWNPTFEFVEQRTALLQGWHRRFCVWTKGGRGSPDAPGLTLALDRGGSCRGIAFRLDPKQVDEELFILWRREMVSGVYEARWVDIKVENEKTIVQKARAITFVANRSHDRFTDQLSDDEIARRIAAARGPLGTCQEYFMNTIGHLEALGLRDVGLERIRRCMSASETSSDVPLA
ncbi:gamma-glutamylcyclotransferase [Paraburkholderia megapolitana]|uniref:gamma-glutamylcyclotransferase n=1 Tax=Paraburkholderia megapolitana TaxID=420953 RepID=UPI0038BCBE43